MKVSDIYTNAYTNVQSFNEEPTKHVITAVGADDNPFDKTAGDELLYICVDDNVTRIRVNKTNAGGLVEAFGDDTKHWLRKTVTIHREPGMLNKKRTWFGVILAVKSKGK